MQFALVFFLGLLLLNVAIVAVYYLSTLREWDSLREELAFFLYQLILWELILVLVVSYVFYQLLQRYLRFKEETGRFQNLLLQAVSHKLGNFLAAQRVDLQLLRETNSRRSLDRLESASSFLERDLSHILRVIRDYPFEEAEEEDLDLGHLARTVLEQLRPELEGKIKLRVQSAPVRGSRQEVETAVFLLLENAARYSGSRVYLRSGKMNGNPYLFLHNDTGEAPAKGSGVGLSIAERLAGRNNLQLRTRSRSLTFAALLYGSGA